MSLILEALKKSEAERRIGQAPGLSTPMPLLGRRRRARWPLAIVIGLVVVALLASSAWFALRRDAAPLADGASPTTTAAPANVAVSRAGEPATPTSAATPGATVSPPATTIAAPPVPAPLPQDPEFASIERESIALPASTDSPAFTAPGAPADIPAPPAPLPVPAPAPVIEAQAATTADAAPDPDAGLEALPRYVDLPASQRDALPALKLSMHVYTEDPATRFVLIDGRRLGEGATLGKALRLAQIRRDGAVLDFDGTRFILPRP